MSSERRWTSTPNGTHLLPNLGMIQGDHSGAPWYAYTFEKPSQRLGPFPTLKAAREALTKYVALAAAGRDRH